MAHYTISSLSDLAMMFDERARKCADESRNPKRSTKQCDLSWRESLTYAEAARITRDTEIVPGVRIEQSAHAARVDAYDSSSPCASGPWQAIEVTRTDAGGTLFNVGRYDGGYPTEHELCCPSHDYAAVQRRAREINEALRRAREIAAAPIEGA